MPAKPPQVEYRYYDMPADSPILALLGVSWYRLYGRESDPLHFHNYLEIGYCHDGSGHIQLSGATHPYHTQSFSIIPANCLHNTVPTNHAKNRWEYLFIDVDTFLSTVYAANPRLKQTLATRINHRPHVLTHASHPELASTILQIMDLFRDKAELYLDCARGLLLALLTRVARMVSPAQDGDAPNAGDWSIERALDFVARHYPEKIQIADIAAACNLSETHFRRLFRQAMHMAPLAYLNLVRIEEASKMLRSSHDSIQRIAERCGFASIPCFNRNFKELMGVAPHKWRKDTAFYGEQLEKQHVMVFNGWR